MDLDGRSQVHLALAFRTSQQAEACAPGAFTGSAAGSWSG